jgi:hypothetical protein
LQNFNDFLASKAVQKDAIEGKHMSPFPIKAVKNEIFYVNLNFDTDSLLPFILKAKDQVSGMNSQIHNLQNSIQQMKF